jgi:hypothetical protein
MHRGGKLKLRSHNTGTSDYLTKMVTKAGLTVDVIEHDRLVLLIISHQFQEKVFGDIFHKWMRLKKKKKSFSFSVPEMDDRPVAKCD